MLPVCDGITMDEIEMFESYLYEIGILGTKFLCANNVYLQKSL